MLDKYQNIRMILHNFDPHVTQTRSVNRLREPTNSKKARSSALRQKLLGCSCIFSAGDLPNLDKGSRQHKKTASREDFMRNGLVGLLTKSLTACIWKRNVQPNPLIEAEAVCHCLFFFFPCTIPQEPALGL
jgi:hypothetical protein